MRVIDQLHTEKPTGLFRQILIFLFTWLAIIIFSAFVALNTSGQTLSGSPGLAWYAKDNLQKAEADFRKSRSVNTKLGTSIDERINQMKSTRTVTAVVR